MLLDYYFLSSIRFDSEKVNNLFFNNILIFKPKNIYNNDNNNVHDVIQLQ